ncbi:glycosyltransferase family 2 protein [Cellulomonas xylanilytica]|uniref:Glycosyltransferase 2-like domain-containing protein n=1 Tax=Cellulomonas xylanilytica TaxID=233583 RepID=A0A510V5G6_9CELL|nr:glycosyltransferase family 2 protein [Cellulomonas xylanilytica]GEK21181.1 hypothetical protein CXY01_17010 [Cellulomonas xylanilytica]
MPVWIILVLLGATASVLGFTGLGSLLIWVGAAVLGSGLVLAVVSRRRAHRAGPSRAPATAEPARTATTWQRRASRLGWTAVGLGTLALGLLAGAAWLLATARPPLVSQASQPALDVVMAVLPVELDLGTPRPAVLLGIGLALAALLVAVGALQAANALRVLSTRRRVEPFYAHTSAVGRRVLGPAAMRSLELDVTPPWPASALPLEHPAVVRCTVLLPAHDEAAIIGASIDSLLSQTRPADRILVVADNCTDDTVAIASARGVEVIETVGNTQAKAGALNQALAMLLPGGAVEDVYLIMDADSTITPDFLEVALGLLESDPELMAVGGLFSGEDGAGVLGQLQRNEFTRYQRVIGRREGHLFVLTGTASVFRGYALATVAQARQSLIPGHPGGVYDTLAMTEDNEITLALKSLGATMTSPPQCRVTTEVMPTWRDLRKQRLRWQRGALENVGAYGLTRTTAIYWVQQLGLAYGAVALHSYLALMAIGILSVNGLRWSPFWVAIGLVFLAERVVTAWGAGWRGRGVAVVIVFELAYSVFLQWAFATALAHIVTRRRKGWNDVPRPAVAVAALAAPVAAALGAVLGAQWNPISAETMQSSWVEALAIFVGVNTLIFATLSVFQMLPPIVKTAHDRRARRAASRPA